MASDIPSNNQTQSQQQTITITAASSGDPELERRIFSEIQSAGRQLKNITAVVDLLLSLHQSTDSSFGKTADAEKAISAFRDMQLQILRAKSLRDPDHLIDQLDALRRADPVSFSKLRTRLNDWLQGNSSPLP